MKSLFLINVYGDDRSGVTSGITGVLASHDVTVLDIGQAVIHDNLALGLLVDMPAGQEQVVQQAVSRDIETKGLHVRFSPITVESYEDWVAQQGKGRQIVTLLARRISAEQLSRLTSIISRHNLNIDRIERLSGRVPLQQDDRPSKACVELSVRGSSADDALFRRECMALAAELDVDIAVQEDNMFRRNRRLVAFDMDSTLIEAEVIDELAREAGVGDQVAAITERAMRGELDFSASFRERVALLKGLDEGVLEQVAQRLPITEGAEELVGTLRQLGYKTAILSGGFQYFGHYLQQRLGIDYVYANELNIENGKVTGRVSGTIVDGERKVALLREIAASEGIDMEQVIAVGDGANDLPMLGAAGLGIAFRAKPLVKERAGQAISALGLDGILYLLGLSDRHTGAE